MMAIPFQTSGTEYSVIIVLEDENLARVKLRDPANLVLKMLGEPWQQLRLLDVSITYASPADMLWHKTLCEQGQQAEALRFLTRGFKFKPEAGDGSGATRIY